MIYPIRHFLATLLIGPLIPVFLEIGSPAESGSRGIGEILSNTFETYPVFMIFGFVCALPTFALYYLSYKMLVKSSLPAMAIKLLLNAEAITGLLITLKLIGGSFIPTAIMCYAIAVVISSLFFKLKIQQNAQNPETEPY